MPFLLLSDGSRLVLVPDGFAGDLLCWSLAELRDAGFRVVARVSAHSWLEARALV